MWRDRFPDIDGVVVNDSGEAGGEVGNASFPAERWREGIDSK